MKRYIMLTKALVVLLMLVGCNQNPEGEIQEPEIYHFEAIVLEVTDASVMVCPKEASNELNCADKISVSLGNVEVSFNLMEGQTIAIEYDGRIAESYPAQIIGATGIELVEEVELEAEVEEQTEMPQVVMYVHFEVV